MSQKAENIMDSDINKERKKEVNRALGFGYYAGSSSYTYKNVKEKLEQKNNDGSYIFGKDYGAYKTKNENMFLYDFKQEAKQDVLHRLPSKKAKRRMIRALYEGIADDAMWEGMDQFEASNDGKKLDALHKRYKREYK